MNIKEMEELLTTQKLNDEEVLHIAQECDSMVVSRLLDVIDCLQAERYALTQQINEVNF